MAVTGLADGLTADDQCASRNLCPNWNKAAYDQCREISILHFRESKFELAARLLRPEKGPGVFGARR